MKTRYSVVHRHETKNTHTHTHSLTFIESDWECVHQIFFRVCMWIQSELVYAKKQFAKMVISNSFSCSLHFHCICVYSKQQIVAHVILSFLFLFFLLFVLLLLSMQCDSYPVQSLHLAGPRCRFHYTFEYVCFSLKLPHLQLKLHSFLVRSCFHPFPTRACPLSLSRCSSFYHSLKHIWLL